VIAPGPAALRAGSAWALASVIVMLCAGLVRTIVTARFLGPADIGLMGIALLALGFVEAVASTGIDTALVAERDDVESYLDPAFTIQVVRGVVVFALLWLTAPVVAWAFNNAAAVDVIRAVAVIAALRGLVNPAVAIVTRRLDFQRLFWWALPEAIASLALTIWLVSLRRDVWALVIVVIVAQAIATLASYGIVPRMPRMVFRREPIHALFRFGRAVSASRALMYFSAYLDAAVVGLTMGTASLGLYQFAVRIAELPVVTFTRAVAQVALPALSAPHAAPSALTRTWRTMLGWVCAGNAAAALAIVLFAGPAVAAIAGPRWLPAVPLMRILAVAMLFRAIVVFAGQVLDALRRPTLTLRLNAERLVALAVLLPLLGAWAGLPGIAAAVLLANAAVAWRALRLSRRAVSG
jgi:PST family polysaccharide transporter/lipopolysaccharide exporter